MPRRARCGELFAVTLVMLAATLRPVTADTLRIGVKGDVATLDPHVLNEAFTRGVLSNVMEGLVPRNQKLALHPGLATD
jgi:peptide/nickel transport system substrate-binding protein